MSEKIELVGLTLPELKDIVTEHGFEKYRASQIYGWIYNKGLTDFAAMSNIAKPAQKQLAEIFSLARPTIDKNLTSFDNTRKWLLRFSDGNQVETVFIPEEDRGALCVFFSGGLHAFLFFCHTGTMNLVRNLTAKEIIEQVLIARDELGEWGKRGKQKSVKSADFTSPELRPCDFQEKISGQNNKSADFTSPELRPCDFQEKISGQNNKSADFTSPELRPCDFQEKISGQNNKSADFTSPEQLRLMEESEDFCGGNQKLFTNIVMMGMGEPLYNYDKVAKALKIIMDPHGIAISKRKITLSTSGVVPAIKKCGEELGVNLAISLHAVRDDLRNELVPLNKKYPIKELLQACRDYPAASNARRITFEYVMLKGINDSDSDAKELCRLLKDIHAKVNLIPWNPWPGAKYETSSRNRIMSFSRIVNDAGYSAPVRATRGQDIFAACGQLKSDSQRKKGEKVWLGNKKETRL